jgi:hypothetical protein
MRKDLRSEKKKIIAMNVPFTADEATRFWPVYDAYAMDMSKHYDAFYGIIKGVRGKPEDADRCSGYRHAEKDGARSKVELAQTRQKHIGSSRK